MCTAMGQYWLSSCSGMCRDPSSLLVPYERLCSRLRKSFKAMIAANFVLVTVAAESKRHAAELHLLLPARLSVHAPTGVGVQPSADHAMTCTTRRMGKLRLA